MRVAINGFGRIGRQAFKALGERHPDLDIVAINDLFDSDTNAHLLKYDSNYGRFGGTIEVTDNGLTGNGREIQVFAEREWTDLPWAALEVDLVIESSGVGTARIMAEKHLAAGAGKVVISAPATDEDITVVLGVNEDKFNPDDHKIISNASCTTNGLAPVVKVIWDTFGISKGMMTTIHAYTNSQQILDVAGPKGAADRELRAGAMNIIPTTTGAARAVALVLPEVKGIVDGLAYRVPTPTVSIVEFIASVKRTTTVDEVNDSLRAAASNRMGGVLHVAAEPLVSMDLKGDTHSSIVDSLLTMVVGGDLVKVAAWYDNEWGYACRVADVANLIATSH